MDLTKTKTKLCEIIKLVKMLIKVAILFVIYRENMDTDNSLSKLSNIR